MIISFSGLDGTGKSTLINELDQYFCKSSSKKIKKKWLRFCFYTTKPLISISKYIELTDMNPSKPEELIRRTYNKLGYIKWIYSFFRIIDIFIVLLLNYWITIFKKENLLCDRFIPDILVDLAVDINEPKLISSNIVKFIFLCIPSKINMCMLSASDEIIMERRPQFRDDYTYDLRKKLYFEMLDLYNIHLVNADVEKSEMMYQVLNICGDNNVI